MTFENETLLVARKGELDYMRLLKLQGPMTAKYEVGSLKRLLCPNNSVANFTEDFEQTMEILRNTDEAVATP